jgi:outer membrane lipoprotein-sorting protein
MTEVEMEIINPNWERTLRMNIWTETMKNTFIDILYPAKEKGSGTLRKGPEMWNYFPKVGKVVKVPPSMMMSSWMGSDFNNDDLVKETTLVENYSAKFLPTTDKNLYTIELLPNKTTVTVWGKIILVVQKKDMMPVREEYYDEKGSQIRTLFFSDYKTFSGRLIPAKLELIPTGKANQKTIIKYLNAKFDSQLPSDTFSLINLQRKR